MGFVTFHLTLILSVAHMPDIPIDFQEQRNFSMVEAVCLFIKFIPLEDEILDFFRPVASQILQRLRSEPCLPADAPFGQVPAWCLPSQLILSADTLLQDIVTPQLLQVRHFSA